MFALRSHIRLNVSSKDRRRLVFDIDDLGYGFKEALPIAVILSFVIITIFALFGGDGIIFGEIPFMIAGFFIFVLFFTISLAWLY